jgi:hypothetical protein
MPKHTDTRVRMIGRGSDLMVLVPITREQEAPAFSLPAGRSLP